MRKRIKKTKINQNNVDYSLIKIHKG